MNLSRNGSAALQKRLFFKNAIILTATAILLRAIGIFFRVYVSNAIGAEGMGLHQLIFSVYTFASALASSGIGIATTRLVSEHIGAGGKSAVKKILSRTLGVSIALGVFSCVLMYSCADIAALYWLKDERAALSLRILSFGLPFMAVSSCLKGYFMARRKASTPSNSQLFEQLIRIAVVVFLLSRVDAGDLSQACAAVVTGNALSEVGACLYIYIGYLRDKHGLADLHKAPNRILRKMSYIGIPVALSSYLNTILHTVENIMVPDALTRYTLSKEASLSQFGMLKGMALPVLFFPSSFLGALSTLLIPEVSEYGARGQQAALRSTIQRTMFLTIVSSVLIGAVFTVYAYEIGYLFYRDYEVGFYILALAPIIPFMYIESIIAGILNGLNQQAASLRYNVYNSAIRIILILFLVPHFGMNAFLAIMVVSNLFTSCLNMRQLFSVTGLGIEWGKWVAKPLLAAAPAMLCVSALKPVLLTVCAYPIVALCAGCLLVCALYLAFLLLFKCITREDLQPLRKRRS